MITIAAAFILAFAAMAMFAIFPVGSRTTFSDTVADDTEPDADIQPLNKPSFPSVEGRNIDGRQFVLPEQFEGLYNVALITYDIDQRVDAAAWIASLRTMENAYPDIHAYELPLVGVMPWLTRERRESRLSSDTTDPHIRANTISIYIDPHAFNGVLHIDDCAQIIIILVDRFGNVLWRERGPCTAAKIEDLENTIVNLLTNVRIYPEN
ncbi:MAG: hypothetical protein F4X40_08680 [Chloroflexi bacterium]|nr:hypothetical protein [Chloroflexota bacterium]